MQKSIPNYVRNPQGLALRAQYHIKGNLWGAVLVLPSGQVVLTHPALARQVAGVRSTLAMLLIPPYIWRM